jgi:hypothetical protein
MPAIRITKDTPGLTITIRPEEEDCTPEESYRVPGVQHNEADVKRFVDAANEMVDEHGLWGWCQVRLTAELGPLKGNAYLSGCSYEDTEDFEQSSGYTDQMLKEALAELQKEIDAVYTLIHVD